MNKAYTSLYNELLPKLNNFHFTELLRREVSNLFKWKGLEEIISYPLLERQLIEKGRLALINHETLGFLVLPCETLDNDLYGRPTKAKINVNSRTQSIIGDYNIYYSDTYDENISDKYCVLIDNMLYGDSLEKIIMFYAKRLAMIWTSIDINLMWQNLPPIYAVPDQDVKQSVQKMVNDIWSGEPLIVTDKILFGENSKIEVGLAKVPFLFNDLHKAHEQVLSDFRAIVGINTSGVTKESGIGETELTANSQSIQTCLQVMKSAREQASNYMNEYFNLNTSVVVVGENQPKGDGENGSSHNRVEHTIEN